MRAQLDAFVHKLVADWIELRVTDGGTSYTLGRGRALVRADYIILDLLPSLKYPQYCRKDRFRPVIRTEVRR